MLYPPGIARQIKHHLLSERVDLDLTASSDSSSTAGGCVDDREVLSFTKDVRAFHTAEYLHDKDDRARFNGARKFVAAKDPGVLGLRVRA